MSRFDRRSHTQTQHIKIDNHKCKACWDCVNTCPKNVIGKVNLFFHKHLHIDYAEQCIGCLKCVKVCKFQAIQQIKKRIV